MTWVASIVWMDDLGTVAVVLSDGVSQKVQQKYTTDGTMANLRPQVLRTIASLSVQAAKRDLVVGQSIDTTPIVVADPIPPTQTDVDRATFLDTLRQMRASRFGLVSTLDAATLTKQAQQLLDAHPEFAPLMGGF